MARQRQKAHPFTIWADTGIPTPDSEDRPSFDESLAMQEKYVQNAVQNYAPAEEDDIWEDQEETAEQTHRTSGQSLVNIDEDDDRRESGFTRTSVSSLPESEYRMDVNLPARSPQVIRPSFMRPESVRRMQMTSPPPFNSRSPRTSIQRLNRSRPGTPKSIRSANARGSPKPKFITSDDADDDEKHYPLVLLHVTILPVRLPWSTESMQELLPKATLSNLHLLKAKVSETIFQRGILIPHPRDEYELLEERLLEALELTQERVTKCGHFRHRSSISSGLSFDSGRESDSAIGSSVGSPVGDQCTTCHHPIKSSLLGAGSGTARWTVRVFAANGLMRASAWAAAWPEMESVDVEILPWISEDMRITLDERREEEEEMELRLREEAEALALKERIEERDQLENERGLTAQPSTMTLSSSTAFDPMDFSPPQTKEEPIDTDLPPVYRRSEIPVSVLLRNYLFLLAQDRRNLAAIFIALLSIVWLLQPTVTQTSGLTPVSTSVVSVEAVELAEAVPLELDNIIASLTPPIASAEPLETESIGLDSSDSAPSDTKGPEPDVAEKSLTDVAPQAPPSSSDLPEASHLAEIPAAAETAVE